MTSSRLIPLIIASALFMENMDSTVIATAFPPSRGTWARTPSC